MLVQLDLRHTASRAMTSGVLRFAAAHRDLEVQFTSCEPNDYYRAWKPNALITDASSQTCTRETLADLAGRMCAAGVEIAQGDVADAVRREPTCAVRTPRSRPTNDSSPSLRLISS